MHGSIVELLWLVVDCIVGDGGGKEEKEGDSQLLGELHHLAWMVDVDSGGPW
jgi:hypothetical protein